MKKILFTLVATLILLSSCGGNNATSDIINPDAEYLYFFGVTCPHCQELNRIAESKDLYSQISIEKREVYHNKENQAMFLALIKDLDVEGSGVPFVYDRVTGKVAVGVKPALELMTSRLGQETVDQDTPITQEEEELEENTETTTITQ